PGPSSQASAPSPVLKTAPSPQTLGWQAAVQAALSALSGPSSHSSPMSGRTKPSLQAAAVQASVQASVLSPLPSSHCSAPSTTPSPQLIGAQLLLHSSSST